MKRRIGLTCHAAFGGSGVIASELGLALAERGHEVHFVCAHAPPRLIDAPHVTLHEVKTPTHALLPHGEFTLSLATRLAEVATAHRLEVLHAHYAIPQATSLWLARELMGGARLPRLVTTVHGTDVLTLGLDPALKPIVRASLLRSDALTAPSTFLANATRTGLELGDRPVELIGNFVDSQHFVPARSRRSTPFADPTLKVLAHASNFRSVKRIEDVVKIYLQAATRVPCGLVLIGDGPERAGVETLVREQGLGQWVKLVGEQRDVVPMLQLADAFLLPSEVESFGLAALEALSCGVPVVATRVGGLPEVVTDGVTGFLHPVGDVAAMANSVVRLLEDPALHRRFATAAREDVLTRWQRGPKVDAYEALYERLLGTT